MIFNEGDVLSQEQAQDVLVPPLLRNCLTE